MVRHVRAERFASFTGHGRLGRKSLEPSSNSDDTGVPHSTFRSPKASIEKQVSKDQAVNQAVRSITRGMGPSSAKLDVPLETCDAQFDSRVSEACDTLRIQKHHRVDFPADTGLVASWFLLRGLEVAMHSSV